MFSDFDFSVLDSPSFKEDAVREEIVAPIIHRLGYRPTGAIQVRRSKTLVHPFVMIGSKRHKVNIIPDYTLYADDKPIAILEAKGPEEPIIHSHHVEQTYSYAIHPEIRVQHYALCNGRELIVYKTDQWEPLLHVPVQELEERWAEVEEALHPRFLTNPNLRGFAPDYGLAMLKAGFRRETLQVLVLHHLQTVARVEEDLYTVCTTTMVADGDYMVSLDLSAELCREMLSRLPKEVSEAINSTLSRAPFQADLAGKVLLTCSGYLGNVTQGAFEEFVPIAVSEISDVVFDPSVTLTP
jgi:type I restriction and modification enzyme subunit R-like protein